MMAVLVSMLVQMMVSLKFQVMSAERRSTAVMSLSRIIETVVTLNEVSGLAYCCLNRGKGIWEFVEGSALTMHRGQRSQRRQFFEGDGAEVARHMVGAAARSGRRL